MANKLGINSEKTSEIVIKVYKRESMTIISPAVCSHCGATYDLKTAKITHRYSDCDKFITPCCKYPADTRMWKSLPDYKPVLKKSNIFPF